MTTPSHIRSHVAPGRGALALDAAALQDANVLSDLSQRLGEHFGTITPETMVAIIKRPVAMRSNLHNAIFMPETGEMWFADAGRKTPACDEPYTRINLHAVLARYARDQQGSPEKQAPNGARE